MDNSTRQYRTGQGVPASGQYRCQSGEVVTIRKGETFPSCPVRGNETTWAHENQ